jgi:hypothetical protein
MKTGLELLVKELPDKQRATLFAKLGISERTWYRWMRDPSRYILLTDAPKIKAFLDRHYGEDHDMAKLTRPLRVRGSKTAA